MRGVEPPLALGLVPRARLLRVAQAGGEVLEFDVVWVSGGCGVRAARALRALEVEAFKRARQLLAAGGTRLQHQHAEWIAQAAQLRHGSQLLHDGAVKLALRTEEREEQLQLIIGPPVILGEGGTDLHDLVEAQRGASHLEETRHVRVCKKRNSTREREKVP